MCTIPWIEQTYPLSGRTVLEYGCGNGAISCALGPVVDRLIGFDIDPDEVRYGARRATQLGLSNVQLAHVPIQQIFDETAALTGEVDVFLLYAVLEHMTAAERLHILDLARRVVRRDGIIVVSELPNRLIPYDGHTSQMPFFAQLPDEVALLYYGHSRREEFVSALDAAVQTGDAQARVALARWGRGVSFHDFECVFGDLADYVLASNYDQLLMAVRDVTREELMLARLLDHYRPDLAPLWGRYWQDVILSPTPSVAPRRHFIRPWAMEPVESPGVVWRSSGTLELGRRCELRVHLPSASSRLLIGVSVDVQTVTITVDTGPTVMSVTEGPWRSLTASRYATIDLEDGIQDFQLRLDTPGSLTFLGYDA
jgi:SAM-dependent methyltransferase